MNSQMYKEIKKDGVNPSFFTIVICINPINWGEL